MKKQAISSFLSQKEMDQIGFKYLGKNVRISAKASIYNAANISIDDNTRVDDFCILSAGAKGIEIGKYVHIGCYSSLLGKAKIVIKDFSGLSARVSIFSSNDDYSGKAMIGPAVDPKYTNVNSADVIIMKHVIIGAGAVILPGITIHEGAAVGALSLVTKNVKEFSVVRGNPARYFKKRSRGILKMEEKFQAELKAKK